MTTRAGRNGFSTRVACLFCHGELGRSRSLEHLPAGRRIAFDPEKGRLWIVCRRCTGWNLVPLHLHWEAVEECEKRFQRTRQRFATDQVGLGRLAEGVELVRVGVPSRSEFAAWRYGDRFGRRRKRAHLRLAAGVTTAAALALAGGAIAASGISVLGVAYGYLLLSPWVRRPRDPVVARLPLEGKPALALTRWDLRFLRFGLGSHGPDWQLDTQQGELLEGEAARVGLVLTLPLLNRWGGRESTRRAAVSLLEEAEEPRHYHRAPGDSLDRLELRVPLRRRASGAGDGRERGRGALCAGRGAATAEKGVGGGGRSGGNYRSTAGTT